MSEEIKYRWIYKTHVKSNGKSYDIYVVYINDQYKYSSKHLQYAIDFVLNFAQKNNIDLSQIIKSKKHPRIQLKTTQNENKVKNRTR
jgi:hypothetical protein